MTRKTKNNIGSSVAINTPKKSNEKDIALISVLENLPIGVVIFSIKKILFLNKAAFKIFKPSSELKKSIYNHSIFEFLLPEYHQRIKENSNKILKGEEFTPFELKIKNAKNEIVDLEVKSNAIVFNGEKAIQTIFTDISDRVKFRDELYSHTDDKEIDYSVFDLSFIKIKELLDLAEKILWNVYSIIFQANFIFNSPKFNYRFNYFYVL